MRRDRPRIWVSKRCQAVDLLARRISEMGVQGGCVEFLCLIGGNGDILYHPRRKMNGTNPSERGALVKKNQLADKNLTCPIPALPSEY
jgi:hypothetical protein